MNKGFAYYFKQAFKVAMKTVWGNKNLLKSMSYFLTTVVARLTVVLGALVSLSDVRHAKIARNQHIVDVPQSFKRASQKPMWTMIVAVVLEGLIYMGGFLLVSVVSVGVFAIGLIIASQVAASYSTLLCIIFAAPGLIIYAVYTIIVLAIFSPTAYVIETNPTLSAGEVVSICTTSMKNRGKATAIACVLVPTLFITVVLGICAAGFVLITLFAEGQAIWEALMVLWAVVSLVIICLTVPTFALVKNVSLVLLFEDIALDPVNAGKRTAGINIKKISGARVDREEVADNLNALFDDRIEEKTPDPDDLVHKHRKKDKKSVKKQSEPVQKPTTAAPSAVETAVSEAEVPVEEVDDYPEEAPDAGNASEKPEQTGETGAGGL